MKNNDHEPFDRSDKCFIHCFSKGMERTAGHNFGGGNTDWEETRLGSFANR